MLSGAEKDEARANRLGRQKLCEEKKIHDTVLKEAAAVCKAEVNDFGQCERANGLLVVFMCRSQNKAMLDCFAKNTTEDHYQAVRERRAAERAEKEKNEAKKD